MGTPLPEVIEGDPCTTCFGPGKTFPDDVTPKYMYVKLIDVVPAAGYEDFFEDFLSAKLQLTQSPSVPCGWLGSYSWGIARLDWDPLGSRFLDVVKQPDGDVFVSVVTVNCVTEYENQTTPGPGTIGVGGRAEISWK